MPITKTSKPSNFNSVYNAKTMNSFYNNQIKTCQDSRNHGERNSGFFYGIKNAISPNVSQTTLNNVGLLLMIFLGN